MNGDLSNLQGSLAEETQRYYEAIRRILDPGTPKSSGTARTGEDFRFTRDETTDPMPGLRHALDPEACDQRSLLGALPQKKVGSRAPANLPAATAPLRRMHQAVHAKDGQS
jgi:hypothetical protein